ncbi:hypothetical protein HCN44_005761 [Aphidius gifuensis]|uniref:U1-type domain-containing protein n=1 Tax=Aphidius gifuensis TaxID=684658 RepID=A0A834XVP4_APHGI|nr:zinc finger matrin-type protein CG9776-like [Aphidius gifuensis]KAF7992980.1 hypothetical protein HCN44_005761 [Aphidius gifuensis]
MENDPRRKGPRSPSVESEDSSNRRRSRKYERDRSPSPRRSRFRRSRSRERRSGSRERRRNKEMTRPQDWNKSITQNPPPPNSSGAGNPGYVAPVLNQYQQPPPSAPNTSQPPPTILPNYNQGYNYNYNYNQGYDYSYQQPPAGYRSDYPQQNWSGNNQVAYNNQQPPPVVLPSQDVPSRPPVVVETTPTILPAPVLRSDDSKKEAIAAEAKQQKATLTKQRDEYVKKSTTLQRELEILREQCDEIAKESGRENTRIVKENQKLQVEIQNKMKSIHNVIDMLTGIIGDKVTVDDLKIKFKNDVPQKRSRSPKEDIKKSQINVKSSSHDKQSSINNDKDIKIERERKIQKLSEDDTKPICNFVHYDPEMHWCKVCNIFPKTAKEYLNHLHSNEHKEKCLEKKIVDMPWHPRNGGGTEKEVPYHPSLPTKRTPIKGLQFFSAATAWYCKLCDSWIGDLHCASLHLKSKRHSENFSRFVEQNPHWETDWMGDREKAFSDERQNQMKLELLKKQKEEDIPSQQQQQQQQQQPSLPPPPTSSSSSSKPKKSKKSKKNKKKSKKRKNKSSNSDSTSGSENTDNSDSDQDMSKSIRVSMRNKMKASTQAILNEEIDYHGIKMKDNNNWNKNKNTIDTSKDNDRHLLNSLRDKVKTRQDNDNKINDRQLHMATTNDDDNNDNGKNYNNSIEQGIEAWGPKEPPKSFWIKKDDDKTQIINKTTSDIPKSDDLPKPHMGFWTKQQVNMSAKPQELNKDDERERSREHYKDERNKYDRRDDKYHNRYDNYDNRRRRDRERDYYDDRRKDRRNDDSPPRRDRNYRDTSPKRGGYDKYNKDNNNRRDDESNDESKFEKKTNESISKFKKNSMQINKKSTTSATSSTTTTTATPSKGGKLPFIGRLPLFKKKNDDGFKPSDKDITPLPYVQSKFEDTPKVPCDIINPPGIVHITKLATPVTLNNSIGMKQNQPAMKILVAPPPPILNSPKSTTSASSSQQQSQQIPPTSTATTNLQQVVDMEIENQSEDTIIEETLVNDNNITTSTSAVTTPIFTTESNNSSSVYTASRPSPFITSNTSQFVQNTAIYPAGIQAQTPFIHPSPIQQTPYLTNHPIIQQTSDEHIHHESTEITKDPSQPLPEDLQEALNIIFPSEDEAAAAAAAAAGGVNDEFVDKKNDIDNDDMYASMYSGMLGCVGYGPEYMDQPPPEITQAANEDNDDDGQPESDDLRMLGIDEGDTIL